MKLYDVDVKLVGDLLSLCMAIGCPNSAACACVWCRCLKDWAHGCADWEDATPRTTATMAEDGAAAEQAAAPRDCIVPCGLHIELGLGNDVYGFILARVLGLFGIEGGRAEELVDARLQVERAQADLDRATREMVTSKRDLETAIGRVGKEAVAIVEAAMEKAGVVPSSYWGRTLVGRHVEKLTKEGATILENAKTGLLRLAAQQKGLESTITEAVLAKQLDGLFELLGLMREIFHKARGDATRVLDTAEIADVFTPQNRTPCTTSSRSSKSMGISRRGAKTASRRSTAWRARA